MSAPSLPLPSTPDVAVVGGGLIALASAAALADAGCRVQLFAPRRRGEASPAAAGMLAPGVERGTGPAHQFALLARDRYPSYVASLAERTGVDVPLERNGVLRAAYTEADAERMRADATPGADWLDAAALAALEPALAPAFGALLHRDDGAVDNRLLLRALWALVRAHRRIAVDDAAVTALERGGTLLTLRTGTGARVQVPRAVLAAGAWTPAIEGLPRPVMVEPVRGQMLALAGRPISRVTYALGGYVVPRRDGRTLVGSTMERVGFDSDTTPEAIDTLRALAGRLVPALVGAAEVERWAGLRPVTPDLQPLLGADPADARVIWACGHSRNGVLLSPLTGECVAALVTGTAPPADLAPFRPDRPLHAAAAAASA